MTRFILAYNAWFLKLASLQLQQQQLQMNNQEFNSELLLTLLGTLLGILNYQENLKQISNDDLLEELRHQDNDLFSIVIKQNELIIRQNREMIRMLRGEL